MFTHRWADHLLRQADIVMDGNRPFDPQVHRLRVYRRALLWGSLGLGDSYVDGDWDCDALDTFFERAIRAGIDMKASSIVDVIESVRSTLLNLQSVRRALRVAEHHYDLGNTLYEKMLGESMAYSSGYYGDGASDLTAAQYAKFDRICAALQLRPGMRVLEIGSGWGSFAAHAAGKYGVSVVGITVSKEQLAYARTRCDGLPVSFYFGDYRTIPPEYDGAFDRAVSIEMIEAVGIKNLRTYMGVAQRALKPDGRFLIQAILGSGVADVWLSTRIFPNGVLPSYAQITNAIHCLFALTHEERFAHDYDKTLCAWDENFRKAWPELSMLTNARGQVMYDQRFYRMWHYYLMVCAGAFRAGKNDVAQLLLQREASD